MFDKLIKYWKLLELGIAGWPVFSVVLSIETHPKWLSSTRLSCCGV